MSERSGIARPSEFDLQPDETKLACGCFAVVAEGGWRITGQAFLCPKNHRLREIEHG